MNTLRGTLKPGTIECGSHSWPVLGLVFKTSERPMCLWWVRLPLASASIHLETKAQTRAEFGLDSRRRSGLLRLSRLPARHRNPRPCRLAERHYLVPLLTAWQRAGLAPRTVEVFLKRV